MLEKVANQKDLGVIVSDDLISLPELITRRQEQDMCEVYKFMHGLYKTSYGGGVGVGWGCGGWGWGGWGWGGGGVGCMGVGGGGWGWGQLLLVIRQPKQNIPNHLAISLEDITQYTNMIVSQ